MVMVMIIITKQVRSYLLYIRHHMHSTIYHTIHHAPYASYYAITVPYTYYFSYFSPPQPLVLLNHLHHLTAQNAYQQESLSVLAMRAQILEEQLASMPPSLSVCVAEKRVVEMKMSKVCIHYV